MTPLWPRYQVPWFLPEERLEEMLSEFDRSYSSELSSCRQNLERQRAFFAQNKLFIRAERYADDTLAGQLASAKERILQAAQTQVEQAEHPGTKQKYSDYRQD